MNRKLRKSEVKILKRQSIIAVHGVNTIFHGVNTIFHGVNTIFHDVNTNFHSVNTRLQLSPENFSLRFSGVSGSLFPTSVFTENGLNLLPFYVFFIILPSIFPRACANHFHLQTGTIIKHDKDNDDSKRNPRVVQAVL